MGHDGCRRRARPPRAGARRGPGERAAVQRGDHLGGRDQDRAAPQIDPALLRRELLNNGYEELPVTGRHAAEVGQLPPLHRDPFDRILVAQARAEAINLVTVDAEIARYEAPLVVV